MQNKFLVETINSASSKLLFFDSDQKVEIDNSTIIGAHEGRIYVVGFSDNLETKSVDCFSINGKKWEFDTYEEFSGINKDSRIKSILGVINEKVWISLSNHTVIALNVENGNLVYQLNEINDFQCEWLPSAIPAPEAIQIHRSRSILVGLMWEFYWEQNFSANLETTM